MKNEDLKLTLPHDTGLYSIQTPTGGVTIKMANETLTPFLIAPFPIGPTPQQRQGVIDRVNRVVQCVNALEGIASPLKMRQTWEVVKDLELDAYHKMKQERDDLVDMFKDLNNYLSKGETIGPKSVFAKTMEVYLKTHKLSID